MTARSSSRPYLIAGWAGMAALYVFLIIPHLNRPIFGWEALVWDIPRQIAEHGYRAVRFFYLAPFYDSLIACSFKLFGISAHAARIPGILCFLAVPAVIYLLGKEIASGQEAVPVALSACAIFFTAPLVIQGSLLIDRSDTTILLLTLSIFYLALLKTEGRPLAFRAALLGALYAVCLWTKVTTPLACLAAVPLAYCMCGRLKEGVKVSAAVFATGITLFVATWWGFCYYVIGMSRFFEPFGYYGNAASGALRAATAGVFTRIGLDIFRIYLWLSPFLIIPALVSAFRVFTRPSREAALRIKKMQLLTFAGVVGAGYLYANATFSGFPKYITPALPMFACLAAKFFWESRGKGLERRDGALLALCIAAGIVFYTVFVKDWVYAVYALRESQLNGSAGSALRQIAVQQALYLSFPVTAFLLSFIFLRAAIIKRLCLVLLAALLASNLALDAMQRKAGYSTAFAYGTKGAQELKAFLKGRQPPDVFSSIEGYFADIGKTTFHCINADVWNDPKTFTAFIEKYAPGCVIYGLAANTVSQLKGTMRTPAVRALLGGMYDEQAFGSYNVLIRRPYRI